MSSKHIEVGSCFDVFVGGNSMVQSDFNFVSCSQNYSFSKFGIVFACVDVIVFVLILRKMKRITVFC